MFGARARQAEYMAWKNASARKATREAEEQSLPPESTPISITAFSKNKQTTRNKGAKQWRPLNLNDIEDEVVDVEQEDDKLYQDAQPDTLQINHEDATGEPFGAEESNVYGIDDLQVSPRTIILQPIIPTAPKAMLSRVRGNALSLQKKEEEKTIPSKTVEPTSLDISPFRHTNDEDESGGWPSDNDFSVWPLGLPFVHRADIIRSVPYSMHHYADLDNTPNKRTVHFLSRNQQHYPSHLDPNVEDLFPPQRIQPQLLGEVESSFHPITHHNSTPFYATIPTFSDLSKEFEFREEMERQSQSVIPPAVTMIPSANFQPRHASFDNDSNFGQESQFTTPISTAKLQRTTPLLSSNSTAYYASPVSNLRQKPYDRSSKLQSFVAAQQALARTGKTVLHNPELYRDDQCGSSAFHFSQKTLSDSLVGSRLNDLSDLRENRNGTLALSQPIHSSAVPKPQISSEVGDTDGMEQVRSNQSSDLSFEDVDSVMQTYRNWDFWGVGSAEWFELRPITVKDRAKMQAAVKRVTAMDSFIGDEYEDPHLPPLIRLIASDISTARDRGRQSKTMTRDTNDFKTSTAKQLVPAGLESPASANKMDQDMHTECFTSKKSEAQRDYFAPYRPPPIFAIERNGIDNESGRYTSLFETTNMGYNAPVRVARDPRYRMNDRGWQM